jgi:hypothetical protein
MTQISTDIKYKISLRCKTEARMVAGSMWKNSGVALHLILNRSFRPEKEHQIYEW